MIEVSSSIRKQTRVMALNMIQSCMPEIHCGSSFERVPVGSGSCTWFCFSSRSFDGVSVRSCWLLSVSFSGDSSWVGEVPVVVAIDSDLRPRLDGKRAPKLMSGGEGQLKRELGR
jgi:hypothetical protein